MIPGYELMAVNAMSSIGLWMILFTRGHVLRALYAMNISGLWMDDKSESK